MTMKEFTENTPLPLEKMPKCWLLEDGRMNALFSPFRSANPQDWKSKYDFWRKMIDDWSMYTLSCCFSVRDLNEAFKRKGCSPLGLATVLQRCVKDNDIIPEADFHRDSSDSWTSWTIDILVKKPVTWSFSTLKSYMIGETINADEKFVYLPTVKYLGEFVLATIAEADKENILITVSEIFKDCKEKKSEITRTAVRYGLIWLKRTKKATFKDNSLADETLVKINSQLVQSITEIDEGLYELKKQEEKLLKEIDQIEHKKLGVLNEAKLCVADKKRQLARTHLRKKAKLDEVIEKKAQVLENVQTLICQIQDSHSNTNILAAYKAGTDVLKKIRQGGLTEDAVADVMDDICEGIQDQQKVESILSESIRSIDSDSDLEKELEELMKAETEKHDIKPPESLKSLEERLSNLYVNDLPSPPQNTPITSPLGTKEKKKVAVRQGETAS